jgi:nudix-type nucleoside diphosphatase (YffH/AdpP family)
MAGSRAVDIRGRKRLFDEFFKVDELVVSHMQNNGTMSVPQRRLVFERGDSAAVLLYNADTKSVIAVNQFRAATLGKGMDDGWITEACAGMIDRGESAQTTVIRETLEETGYKIREVKPIAKFFASPGGTSECIHLFYAEVANADKVAAGGGIGDEDVEIRAIPVDQLFDMVDAQRIEDPKLLIGALWLRRELQMGGIL